MLDVLAIPAFTDNYIWCILNRDTQAAAVVDPGDATPVREFCDQNGIHLSAILVTHHHHDHIGGVAELAEHYNTPVYGPAGESIPNCSHPLLEGDTIAIESLDNLKLSILDLPGHTLGHIAYVGHGWLFCGDTLFAGGCGRIFEGTAEQMFASLEKLKSLPADTLVFCAHEYTLANLTFALSVEPNNAALQSRIKAETSKQDAGNPTLPSTIELERATNPFLRCDSPEIVSAANANAPQKKPQTPVAVFAVIREVKDKF